ncbi:MAG: DUF4145 domain-containing protein [Chloroflexi bacterium]|nr:DUF4145 domain-containing protein [Chloroflexota bacterium]
MVCNSCGRSSIYQGQPQQNFSDDRNLEDGRSIHNTPVQIYPKTPVLREDIPERTRNLFKQAATCLRYGLSEPAGAMFRKTIDVGTKEFYSNDARLKDKQPANALRSRLKALGDMKILDADIVELADIAALDGNDATHDEDPYTTIEAEALEELTIDLLDRLFVRPATIARVRAKQIASGLRKSDVDTEGGGV